MAGAERPIQALNLRAGALALVAWCIALHASAQPPPLALEGRLVQGGYAVGRTAPNAQVLVDGRAAGAASADGLFVVGFDRDSAARVEVRVRTPDGEADRTLQIAAGVFDIQRIDGLPQDQVTPTDPALLARIAAERARKAVGFASLAAGTHFTQPFILPVPGARLSARFGGQRILDGEPKQPHYGDDLAAPVGTPVLAPADGVVAFAETGLHYEGGLIMIDHGQGLISLYLHLSRVDVSPGQAVRQGQVIAAVGQEGRATGPHLCWRMKWRGRNLDPMLLVRGAAGAAPDMKR